MSFAAAAAAAGGTEPILLARRPNARWNISREQERRRQRWW